MWFFKRTIGEAIALISFIPVITGMGGNVGIQSSTITVRGLATGRVRSFNFKYHLIKEIKVAFLMANICGATVGLIAFLWHGEAILGLVVGLAMFCAMTIAVLMGTLMPLILRKLGVDPAVASGPFVTTANDVVGILIYMIIATIFLKYLSG
ncbi:MAG TPA: magnesium transporter [Candidatus Desulfofervidus auxilii]|uniref:Magnesium transporter n=1 Tax=Desulfofervidus auxilii TaxID=1621989 RepID=A0A7C0Y2C4_DESA2|nr:magnesium transporter [Candidatus Desulfofervidus auxilii]